MTATKRKTKYPRAAQGPSEGYAGSAGASGPEADKGPKRKPWPSQPGARPPEVDAGSPSLPSRERIARVLR